jgi:Uma2 family endonuclease
MADIVAADNLELKKPKARVGEPVWEIAYLFPNQGTWSVEDYLGLDSNCLIEYINGHIEVLPMPSLAHQLITLYLYRLLHELVSVHELGVAIVAPLPVRLGPQAYREPDVIFLSTERYKRIEGKYPSGADLVVEVVSEGVEARKRDLVTKRKLYAQAGISEYWIVDPQEKSIIVLSLEGSKYIQHGRFTPGMIATSILLPGFMVSVDEVFAAASSGR